VEFRGTPNEFHHGPQQAIGARGDVRLQVSALPRPITEACTRFLQDCPLNGCGEELEGEPAGRRVRMSLRAGGGPTLAGAIRVLAGSGDSRRRGLGGLRSVHPEGRCGPIAGSMGLENGIPHSGWTTEGATPVGHTGPRAVLRPTRPGDGGPSAASPYPAGRGAADPLRRLRQGRPVGRPVGHRSARTGDHLVEENGLGRARLASGTTPSASLSCGS
jgi:hypothetical protein